MKKWILILYLVPVLLMFPGCSSVNDFLRSRLDEKVKENLKKSLILEDQEYQQYQGLKDSGQLGENGYYLDAIKAENKVDDGGETSGTIQVTFVENSYIKFTYYLDAECTEQINTLGCYLNPGDRIYASKPEISGAYSDKYVFSEFRILKFNSNNQPETFATILGDDNLLFEIPADYAGDMVSIMPLGRYEKRVLTLADRYLDIDGKETEFHGVWRIDSNECKEAMPEISSIVDYKVSYDYSDYVNDYYFVKSNPEPFRVDDSGIVEFNESTAQNGCEDYYVLFHRYINVKMANEGYSIFNQNIVKSLRVNGVEQDNFKKDKLTLERRKCGDEIKIGVDSGYKVTAIGLEISAPIDVDNGNTQEYTITVPETTELELGINVSKKTATLGGFEIRTINNAIITVTDGKGNVLQSGEEVDDSEKITVTITPTSGYYVTGKLVKEDVYQNTMEYKKYVSDIDKIIKEHPVKKLICVTLDTSDDYGTCVYKVDGRAVSGTVTLREGQSVKLEYMLTDNNYQIDGGWFDSKTKKTEKIKISEDYDGRALSREDFKIQIKKK